MKTRRLFALLVALMLGLLWVGPVRPAKALKDTESASHGDEAAKYQIVNTYQYPGFKLVQFNLAVLSHYSYLLVSGDQALVVDPGRDVFAYLDQAQKEGVRIMGVLLTHNHADFVAGHMELAKRANCPIYASASSGCAFRYQPLKEGSVIEVGEALVKILVTPGHTPEGICGLVASKSNPKAPLLLLSGDTLFIGSIGRPDLMGGSLSAAALASLAFDTWTKKLRHLPDNVALFPAHGAGSLCGAHLSDEPTSTLGVQKKSNSYLQHKNRGEFIAAVLEGLPEAPQYFKHNAEMNKRGPQLVSWEKPPVSARVSRTLTDPKRFSMVDLRSAREYAAGHIPNSVNIGLRGRLETWVGTMVPWNAKLILYGKPAELQEATSRLYRVGYVAQVVTPEDWEKARVSLVKSEFITPQDLKVRMEGVDSPVVVDVRLPTEWKGQRLGRVLNLPLNQLSLLAPMKLDPTQPVITVCNSAYRSSMAVGILEGLGFQRVGSLDGGTEAWIEAGLPVVGTEPQVAKPKAPPTPPKVPKRTVRLPQRIDAADLKRTLLDLPGTFDLVDIRPPEAFADFHLPGSVNADVVDVMQSPSYLKGTGPLILVDRDGSLAMAVGGILSQKTWRPIKVLHGGLEAYWQELVLKPAVQATPLPGNIGKKSPAPGGQGTSEPAPPSATPAPSPAPTKPKKKSAGC